jgi:prepilin-type N-terminal cleavage/methylation domain-containing protein
VDKRDAKGFTLLEFLLSLSLLLLLVTAASSFFRHGEGRLDGTVVRTEFALIRAKLIHQLEDDLLRGSGDDFLQLPNGAIWNLSAPTLPLSRCAYLFDGSTGRLYRFLLGEGDAIPEENFSERNVLIENVEEFSLSFHGGDGGIGGNYVLRLRLRGESSTASISFL